jgi:hypothetical protein
MFMKTVVLEMRVAEDSSSDEAVCCMCIFNDMCRGLDEDMPQSIECDPSSNNYWVVGMMVDQPQS